MLFLVFFYSQLNAQNLLYAIETKIDGSFIKSYKDKLTLRLVLQNKNTERRILNNSTAKELIIKPNNGLNIGVGFNWRFIGGEIVFNSLNINNQQQKGKTKALDLRFILPINTFLLEPYYVKYSSYYINNPTVLEPNYWLYHQEYPIFKSAKSFNVGITAYHVFNATKYTYKGVFIQNLHQIQSQGSWLAGIYIDYRAFHIGDKKQENTVLLQNNPLFDINNERNTSFGITGGYAYTKSFRNGLILSGAFTPGFGINQNNVVLKNNTLNQTPLSIMFKGFIAMNYDKDKWFTGINFNFKSSRYLFNDAVQIFDNFGIIRIQTGYRF